MPITKKNEVKVTPPLQNKEIEVKTKHALVFISHDSRDAELADEFGKLLRSVSTGALKSFSSSDKKGTTGIPYGQEWYPAIMEKIDEASDVVCLLTKHSVDRPWILYEAGVAKGKLDKKVIGIALGISLSEAISGPFAQFQNNDGDSESITKLILELIKKVPSLDPDEQLVRQLVDGFVEKSKEINEKLHQQNIKGEKQDNVDENSVAKLFEEVKIMFDNLPAKIENRIDPDLKRRKRKFHPMMFDEIMHFDMGIDDPFMGFLMFISLYKEDVPWFYEIGLETYRGLKNAKNLIEKEKLMRNLEKASKMLRHPMMREFHNDSKESYMLLNEAGHFIHMFFERIITDKKSKE